MVKVTETAVETRFLFSDFEVDTVRRVLLKNGQPIALNPKAFDLLVALLNKHGEIVSKNDLLDAVWENQIVEEKNLAVQVSTLRKVFGERKDENRFIVTVPGTGYKFVAALKNEQRNELIIETQKIERIIIEEFDEPQIRQLSAKNSSTHYFAFFLFPSIILLFIFGFFVWKYTGRINKSPLLSKRLTTIGNVQIATLSRDGEFFAYSVKEKGSFRSQIRLGQTDGSSDKSLIPMSDDVFNPMSFSEDGSHLYYVQSKPRKDDGILYKIPILGGIPQKLAILGSSYLNVSPDEKQIAFVQNNDIDKTSAIVLTDIYGANERKLVVFHESGELRSIKLSWSSDSSLIAFSSINEESGSREVYIADVTDGKIIQLTNFDWFEIAKLEWLKDKSGILAIGRDKKITLSTQIWQIDYPSGTVQAITGDVSKYGSVLSVSEDSSELIAVQTNMESNIWTAPADNLKEIKQITFSSVGRQDGWYGLDWTPDGKIVYSARIDQSLPLWIMNSDGTNMQQLTSNGFWDKHAKVSADGSTIIFDSNRSGQVEIWRVGIDGNGLQQLTFDGGNSNPSVTSDNKLLVYQHSVKEENSIRRMNLMSGESITLISENGENPQLSPDGKFIACGYSMNGKAQLGVLPVEGEVIVKTFDVPPTHNFENTAIRWSPDGQTINYRDWSNGIWSQSIKGGIPIRLENLPQEKLYTYGWSSDRKQFAFARGQEIRDVILINNFR